MTDRIRLTRTEELYAEDVLAELLYLLDTPNTLDLRALMLKYPDDPRAAARAILQEVRVAPLD